MRRLSIVLIVLAAFCVRGWAEVEKGLVAHWDFDEGKGDVLHDRSGNNNHGKIHGAKWAKCGTGYALKFDGVDDYVDCGTGPSLDINGPITLAAWVCPLALPKGEPGVAGKFLESYALTYYKDGAYYWYISSGGNNVRGPFDPNAWTHVAGTFDGSTMRIYMNGIEFTSRKSKFKTVNHGKNFLMGCVFGDPTSDDINLRRTSFLLGLIDSVRVHNRALSQKEILQCYNLDAQDKGHEPFDMSRLDKFEIEPFFYPNQDKAVLSVNFRWVKPIPKGAELVVEMASVATGKLVGSKGLSREDPRCEGEAEFSLKGLEPGTYKFGALVRDVKGDRSAERVTFRYPFDPLPPVVPPKRQRVPKLPPAVNPPRYDIKVSKGGGFFVNVKGKSYRIESTYSYPHGGENRLTAGSPDTQGEAAWEVKIGEKRGKIQQVTAAGKYYDISRTIEPQATRIIIKDTIRNKWDDVLGVILSNHVNLEDAADAEVTRMDNPTIFVARGNGGVGLIALDDLYQLQQNNAPAEGIAGVRDEHFGLDKGASYTLEWAVYPTATTDYYDFINQVRKDEGLNARTEGTFVGIRRFRLPSREFIDLRHARYLSVGTPWHPIDDPGPSIEGIEFMKYPKECARIRKFFDDVKRTYPEVKVMIHVFPGLYCCNDPQKRFPDSLAIDVNGRQFHYGPNSFSYYGRYWSKEMFDDNWRWWYFYPTLENSFGKAMIQAMEYMMDEMGATGMWGDGYLCGAPGGYSYDRWDGHSVTIDPETKLVTRKKNLVPHTSLPVLREVIRLIADRGGVLITNGLPGPRSLWREHYLTSAETGGGNRRPISWLHLAHTVTPLGHVGPDGNERDVYRDILAKLDYGALYWWYRGKDLMRHKTLVEHMYPITFESIHAGTVRGKERIVTKKSGVYGWHGNGSLHIVYLYDARGELTRSNFMTTVDKSSVRTEVKLEQDQSAAVVKLPITLTASGPVNLVVRQYDINAIRLVLNGKGTANVRVRTGDFIVKPGAAYRITTGRTQRVTSTRDGLLLLALTLDGPATLLIEND